MTFGIAWIRRRLAKSICYSRKPNRFHFPCCLWGYESGGLNLGEVFAGATALWN
jgi:hypothetical protein